MAGTKCFLPPEVIIAIKQDILHIGESSFNMFKVDIYSLALTILYIVLSPTIPKLTELDKLH